MDTQVNLVPLERPELMVLTENLGKQDTQETKARRVSLVLTVRVETQVPLVTNKVLLGLKGTPEKREHPVIREKREIWVMLDLKENL